MVGAIDVASNQIETPEEVANTLRKSTSVCRLRQALPLHKLRYGASFS